MRLPPYSRIWRRCGYLLGVAVSLCAYLLTAFGFPVFVLRVAKDDDRPAPATVATRPCGCAVDSSEGGCCCSRGAKGGKPSCCGGEQAQTPAPASDAPAVDWVLGESVLRCRGIATAWVSAGAVLPPPRPLSWRPAESCCALSCLPAPLPTGVPQAPPSPPPRPLPV
jgi:hypothetical protein